MGHKTVALLPIHASQGEGMFAAVITLHTVSVWAAVSATAGRR